MEPDWFDPKMELGEVIKKVEEEFAEMGIYDAQPILRTAIRIMGKARQNLEIIDGT